MQIISILLLVVITDKSECFWKLFQKPYSSLFPIANRREWYESRHHTKVNHSIKPKYISAIIGQNAIKISIGGKNPNKIEPKNCGVSDVISTQIINGQYANSGEFPWIVSLQENNEIMGCAGSILNERWIISAAHCFQRRNGNKIKLLPASAVSVKVGSNDITEGTKYYISKIIIHDQYDDDLWFTPDIALIKTQTDILMQKQENVDLVNSICLPNSKGEEPLSNSLEVIGWGERNPKDVFDPYMNKRLMKVSIPIISDKKCNNFYNSLNGTKIDNSQICLLSVSESKDACQGDSGGPAFEFVNDRAVLIGIVSWGQGCAEGYPGVYTQVSYFLDWIAEYMI